jgi:uncharacterized protein YbjT (DUF2867 family)
MIRNALIVGASGMTGYELLQVLIKSDYYNSVYLAGRRDINLEHPKIKSYIIDFEDLENFKPDGKINDVYICLGTTRKKAGSKENFRKVDHDFVVETGKWAKNNNADKVCVISSMGTNPKTSNFYLKTKAEMEADLIDLGLPSLIIMRPSLLLGKRNEFRLGEKIGIVLMKLFGFLFRGKLKRYKAIQSSDVANTMFKATLNAAPGITIVENESIDLY